jgi:hypothetical protein
MFTGVLHSSYNYPTARSIVRQLVRPYPGSRPPTLFVPPRPRTAPHGCWARTAMALLCTRKSPTRMARATTRLATASVPRRNPRLAPCSQSPVDSSLILLLALAWAKIESEKKLPAPSTTSARSAPSVRPRPTPSAARATRRAAPTSRRRRSARGTTTRPRTPPRCAPRSVATTRTCLRRCHRSPVPRAPRRARATASRRAQTSSSSLGTSEAHAGLNFIHVLTFTYASRLSLHRKHCRSKIGANSPGPAYFPRGHELGRFSTKPAVSMPGKWVP